MGPTVEQRNKAHLDRLRKKYGDCPEEKLLQMAKEATEKGIQDYYKKKRQRRKTA